MLTLAFSGAMPLAAAENVAAGFREDLLISGSLGSPTDLAFTPDGRLLITSQYGALFVVRDGVLVPQPALWVSQYCADGERGLLGAAVDPAFATNHRIYLYYTAQKPDLTCVNRVSRFVLADNDTVDPASEVVLLDNMISQSYHNGGGLGFGKDGLLYVSIGDGYCDFDGDGCQWYNDAARDLSVLLGKILRITTTGLIPAGNPFQGTGTARCGTTGRTTPGTKCREIFAYGLRNPFRFAFDPNASGVRLFINDVGETQWEEIDAGTAGGDYGWNCREGSHLPPEGGCATAPAGMIDPLFEYQHGVRLPGSSGSPRCSAITGGAFVPNGLWPGYDGAYLFGDYECASIFALTPGTGGWSAADLIGHQNGEPGAVALRFGPYGATQALYYLVNAGGGLLYRVSWTGGADQTPTAVAGASPLTGQAPLTVSFDAAGSGDPDPGDVLAYFWDPGDGSPEGEFSTFQHTYAAPGTYTATLRVRDNHFVFAPPVHLQVQVTDGPPILFPAASYQFTVGQPLVLSAFASDWKDGPLAPGAFTWTILRHRGALSETIFGPVSGNDLPFTGPAPDSFAAAVDTDFEIDLSATNSRGLTATAQIPLQPQRVVLGFVTVPAGLSLALNGTSVTAPQSVTSWAGYPVDLLTSDQESGGTLYLFASWSDHGAPAHRIVTPGAPVSYTATFQPSRAEGPADFTSLTPCRAIDTRGPDGPALFAGSLRNFPLRNRCGIPSTAKAVVASIAVVPPVPGYLTVYRADELPGITSTINFQAGVVRSTNEILPLSAAGAIGVKCGANGPVDLIVDVVGYFD